MRYRPECCDKKHNTTDELLRLSTRHQYIRVSDYVWKGIGRCRCREAHKIENEPDVRDKPCTSYYTTKANFNMRPSQRYCMVCQAPDLLPYRKCVRMICLLVVIRRRDELDWDAQSFAPRTADRAQPDLKQ